jgi:hypothetical protein
MKKALFAAIFLTALLALAGAEAQKFFCKFCGQRFRTLCPNNPAGRGTYHEPAL